MVLREYGKSRHYITFPREHKVLQVILKADDKTYYEPLYYYAGYYFEQIYSKHGEGSLEIIGIVVQNERKENEDYSLRKKNIYTTIN